MCPDNAARAPGVKILKGIRTFAIPDDTECAGELAAEYGAELIKEYRALHESGAVRAEPLS